MELNQDLDVTDPIESSLNPESDLDRFRQQYFLEVALEKSKQNLEDEKSGSSFSTADDNSVPTACSSIETQAEILYNKGVECENNGQMNAAIQFYRLAIQKDPDVEEKMMRKPTTVSKNDLDEETENSEDFDLLAKFLKLNLSDQEDGSENESLLLTDLPFEVLSLICKYVISSHVDARSLECLSETCRKFYILARDQTVWKAICQHIWGRQIRRKPYPSWRNMFINKPHIRFDGVYISKVVYFREGDPTVLSNFYSPVQCVEYYRYNYVFFSKYMYDI